jgi:hypothetical protein
LLLVRSSKAIRVKKQLRAGNILLPGIPEGEAGAQVTFLRENATFLAAVEVSERRVADKYKLEQELTVLVQAGDFPPDYVVITDLVTARSARIFISSKRGDSVTVSGELDAPLGLAGIGAKLTIVVDNTVELTFEGTRGVTPLYRPMGFMIGGKIRRLKRRLLSRGPKRRVPRIVIKSLDAKPAIGKPITVRPVEGDEVAICPVERPPFAMESAALKPFTVEPIMLDAGVIGAVIPGLEAPHLAPAEHWAGLLLGAVEGDPEAGELIVHTAEDVPVLVQPVDDDPFLVKVVAGEGLAFGPAKPKALELPEDLSGRELGYEDSLQFGYVDFDAELADAEIVSE